MEGESYCLDKFPLPEMTTCRVLKMALLIIFNMAWKWCRHGETRSLKREEEDKVIGFQIGMNFDFWQWASYHLHKCHFSNSHRRLDGYKNAMVRTVNNSRVIDWSQLHSSFLIYILSNFFLYVFYFFIHLKTRELSPQTKAPAGEDWILFNLLFFSLFFKLLG